MPSRSAARVRSSVRQARKKQGLPLAQLGSRGGCSAAQVSRYERGISPLTDVTVLRRLADALGIPPQALGLTPEPEVRHGRVIGPITAYPRLPGSRVGTAGQEDGEDRVRRRQLLARLAVTAAAAAGAPVLTTGRTTADEAALGDALTGSLRDAMLGLHTPVAVPYAAALQADRSCAFSDFHACRYGRLAVRLPRLIW
ncbi:helix-turn-helix domain-containing protein, partial [Streptomyces sp. NBRC 110611]|uniref:helix-turn-helix domain-containing protein n=1 Tax=Streptomyces sp. NBRC 110611 TaxID=1621259 RepID=UPI0011BED82F